MAAISRYGAMFLFIFATSLNAIGQSITNITATFDNLSGSATINYDLNSNSKTKRYKVEMFCSEDGGATYAALVGETGDVGYNIKPGKGKVINWAYFIDLPEFKGKNVVFKIVAKEDTEYKDNIILSQGGPEKFYQSILIPGYGNYHVRNGKGYMAITAAVGALLATGTYFHFKSNDYYSDYKNSTSAEVANSNFDKAQQYSNVSRGLLGAGVAVWTIDVGQVIFKGLSNRRKQKEIILRRQK